MSLSSCYYYTDDCHWVLNWKVKKYFDPESYWSHIEIKNVFFKKYLKDIFTSRETDWR